MPREIGGWLGEVIRHSMRKPVIRMHRDRPIYSLSRSIGERLNRGFRAIIAEYKRRSPSGLYIDRDPVEYVKFLEGYVAGFSVLTEERYFGGSPYILNTIARSTNVPILMKDFIVSEQQIETAYNIGADAVLLIASILTEREVERLMDAAKDFGLEVLLEIHSHDEIPIAINSGARIIGVNSRDLRTLRIDIDHAISVLRRIPDGFVKVAESGIRSRDDIVKLEGAGARAFLIGTTLMRNPRNIMELL